MFRKTLLITALCVSSIGLTGCSSMWSAASVFSSDMAELTKFSFLRGKSKKSDISFAENNVDLETGVYKTEVGEYIPAAPTEADFNTDFNTDFKTDVYANGIDTSPHPCPDGTYLTEDNSCMSLETDTYDFAALDASSAEQQFIDTSQHECPEGTYLNAENACMYFETETFDFEDDNTSIDMVVDTSPHPCPEGTYLSEDETCTYFDIETIDSALKTDDVTTDIVLNTPSVTTAPSVVPAVPVVTSNSYPVNVPIDCPKGFVPNGDNCMYLGAELQQ